jgi:hypothetical protein
MTKKQLHKAVQWDGRTGTGLKILKTKGVESVCTRGNILEIQISKHFHNSMILLNINDWLIRVDGMHGFKVLTDIQYKEHLTK